MPGFFDRLKVPVPCEECGKNSDQEMSRLQGLLNFSCLDCGSLNELDADQLQEQLGILKKATKEAIDRFGKGLVKVVEHRKRGR